HRRVRRPEGSRPRRLLIARGSARRRFAAVRIIPEFLHPSRRRGPAIARSSNGWSIFVSTSRLLKWRHGSAATGDLNPADGISLESAVMIIDHAVIHVRSGKGGDGAVSFRREKYIPRGGPDGGDGGDGGSVILVADPQVDTLLDFAGRQHWHAEDGGKGAAKQQHGRNGRDLDVRLPPGTLVYDEATGELLVDLDAPGRTFVVARGGRG